MSMFTIRRFGSLLLLLAPLALGACDNPVEGGDENHAEGILILDAQGQEAARLALGPTVTGELTVARNGTQTYRLVGLAEDGDRVPLGGEFTAAIGSQPVDGTVAIQGTDQLVATGGATGGTSVFTLQLLHNGHPDVQGSIPLAVQ